jgi:hypothetical protein
MVRETKRYTPRLVGTVISCAYIRPCLHERPENAICTWAFKGSSSAQLVIQLLQSLFCAFFTLILSSLHAGYILCTSDGFEGAQPEAPFLLKDYNLLS